MGGEQCLYLFSQLIVFFALLRQKRRSLISLARKRREKEGIDGASARPSSSPTQFASRRPSNPCSSQAQEVETCS